MCLFLYGQWTFFFLSSKAKKAMVDAARLADELRAEQEHAQTQVLNVVNNV